MLLQIPVELQTEIISLLPRKDLASLVRVSQHVYGLAIRLLYEHVELWSLERIQSFFLVTSTFRTGSAAESKHAEAKMAEWELIKTLEIRLDITIGNRIGKRPLGNLPRALRGRRSNPIHIDRLRLSDCSEDELNALAPVLTCFHSPFIGLDATGSWYSYTSVMTYPSATFAAVVSNDQSGSGVLRYRVWRSIELLVQMCPRLEKIELLAAHEQDKQTMSQTIQNGLAGKPASFFVIRDKPAGSNAWGELEDDT